MNSNPYARRRRSLLEAISPGIALVPSAPSALRNNDVEHAYRQSSDLYYLTGFDEPDSVAVLSTEKAEHFTLFLRDKDPVREVWDGRRLGPTGAVSQLGADKADVIAELDGALPDLLVGHRRVYTPLGVDPAWDEKVLRAITAARRKARRGGWFPTEVVDLGTVLHEMRRIKDAEEIVAMRRAIDLSARAHILAMQTARPGMNEGEIDALFYGHCRAGGAARLAYESIVGSGPNATVLHYVKNDRQMQSGELVLLDAGCEVDYYASDITRTFPVSGRFTEAQASLYDLVLVAQKRTLAECRPGTKPSELQATTVRVLTEGLVSLGLLSGTVEEAIEKAHYKRYYMHNVSHYLGMDVHDVGLYYRGNEEVPLEPGVVVTVEPGIYVATDDTNAPEVFRGIGIRIEDDVLITESGHDVLSSEAPKERVEVEALASSTLAPRG